LNQKAKKDWIKNQKSIAIKGKIRYNKKVAKRKKSGNKSHSSKVNKEKSNT